MNGVVDWQVLVFVLTVFGGGATLAWFFSSVINKQSAAFDAKIDESSTKLHHRMDGLDVVSRSDRASLSDKIESFDLRDQREHKEMLEQITQVRIAIGQLETKRQASAARSKQK